MKEDLLPLITVVVVLLFALWAGTIATQAQSSTPTPLPGKAENQWSGTFLDLHPFADKDLVILLESITKTDTPLTPPTAEDKARAKQLMELLRKESYLVGEVRYVGN